MSYEIRDSSGGSVVTQTSHLIKVSFLLHRHSRMGTLIDQDGYEVVGLRQED